jgi:hypothetical protein
VADRTVVPVDVREIAAIVAATAALLGLVVGYLQLLLPRSLLPCIEFDVDFVILSRSASNQLVGEVACNIKNVGPGVGYVTNVQCRVLGRLAGESGFGGRDGTEPSLAYRVCPADQGGSDSQNIDTRGCQSQDVETKRKPLFRPPVLYLLPAGERKFIQPHVTQWYRKPLALPRNADLISVWGGFEYELEVGKIRRLLGRLTHQAQEENPVEYTVRRTFTATALKSSPTGVTNPSDDL